MAIKIYKWHQIKKTKLRIMEDGTLIPRKLYQEIVHNVHPGSIVVVGAHYTQEMSHLQGALGLDAAAEIVAIGQRPSLPSRMATMSLAPVLGQHVVDAMIGKGLVSEV